MSKKLVLIIISGLIVVVGGYFLLGSKPSPTNNKRANNKKEVVKKSNKKQIAEGITALRAWEKVRPEVEKWSKNYKIAKISNAKSYAKFQCKDGLGDVWEFYLEDCQKIGSFGCSKGKTRSFYYATEKGGWGPKGVFAEQEIPIPSGLATFLPDKLKIDTDEAVNLARRAFNKEKSDNEDFEIETMVDKNGNAYWRVIRKCSLKSVVDKSCNSQRDGYTAYVNIETGQTLTNKPRTY